MTQQTEKICFRYDGSEEAKKALEWMNEKNETAFVGIKNKYYTNDGNCYNNILRTYRLVTPAEFLRIVTVETEPKWRIGDECMVDGLKCKIHHVTDCGVLMLEDLGQTGYFHIRHSDFVSPVRKSVREELHNFIKDEFSCYIALKDIDRIIDIIKQAK